MKQILILFAHPAYHRSRVHRQLVEALDGLEGVTFHDLYEEYPTMHIRAKREQALLRKHDIIIYQHPLYCYSSPAILKEWQDLVLEHGFAYGGGGTALQGKRVLSVVSSGGTEESYQRDGMQRFTMREFLVPFDQMAHLCGMEYLPPFVIYGTYRLTPEVMERHACDYRQMLIALRDETLNLDLARQMPSLNSDLAALLTPVDPGSKGAQ